MGQRHQIFVIARVKARGSPNATYRCVAAYHHQWCYGTLPLKAALRFFTLIKQPDNADVIREEILALDGKYDPSGEEPSAPDVPCRFVATVLGNSWDITKDGDYLQVDGTYLDSNLLPVDMDIWDGDNNDGLTIMDVSDPTHPHCSFFVHRSNRPRTALGYLQEYYPDEVGPNPRPVELPQRDLLSPFASARRATGSASPEPTLEDLIARREARRASLLSIVGSFSEIPPLSPEMLAQAWPNRFKLPSSAGKEVTVGGVEEDEEDEEDGKSGNDSVPSLVEVALREALKHGIDTDDVDRLGDMAALVEKADVVEAVMREYAVFPDAALPLLSKLIQAWKRNDAVSIDLSGFNLSDGQLETVLHELDGVRTINLSRNPSLTIAAVELLLDRLSHLRRLLIMSCPSITDDAFTTLWRTNQKLFSKLDALYHPALCTSLTNPPSICLVSTTPFNLTLPAVSVMVASPAVVVQSLLDFWEFFEPKHLPFMSGRMYEVAWGMPRTPEQGWSERGVLPSFFGQPWMLLDAPFSSWMIVVQPSGYGRRTMQWAFVPYTVSEASEPAQEQGTEETADKSEENQVSLRVGEVHGLRDYLHKVVEEDGKLPAPEEAVSRLEELASRLEVKLMERSTVMDCIYGRLY